MRTSRLLVAASTLAVVAIPFTARAQVVTASGGEVTVASQKTFVDRLIVGDSIEVAMAQLAIDKSKNPAVKELAMTLANDHRTRLEALKVLAGKPDVGRAALPGDNSAKPDIALLMQLQSLPDSTFDRAFVTAQIARHERSIDALKSGRAAAKSPDLQKDIDAAIPVAEQHLAKAKAVAAELKP